MLQLLIRWFALFASASAFRLRLSARPPPPPPPPQLLPQSAHVRRHRCRRLSKLHCRSSQQLCSLSNRRFNLPHVLGRLLPRERRDPPRPSRYAFFAQN